MSRDDGFDVADVSTVLLDDPKIKALWRSLNDESLMGRAVTLHLATVLASWRQGCRVTVQEAVPLWITPDPALIAALQAAGLLDRTGKLPPRSWKGWFGPAWERREARREAGRKGGQATVKQRLSVAEPVRPSVPSGPSDRTPRASDDASTEKAADAARRVAAELRLAR